MLEEFMKKPFKSVEEQVSLLESHGLDIFWIVWDFYQIG